MAMSAGAVDIHALAAARVGQILRGKWRLDSLLGVGGSACVYAATHRNGKRGAVKLLRPELCTNDEAKRRFLREGYVANRIEHPGAVVVLDDDTSEDGSVFLVMELLEGQTLEEYARACPGGRVTPSDIALVVDKLLDVLASAHDKGIVHRDLKPENIFLTVYGEVKILDFGTARVHDAAGGAGRMTEVGHIMGTPSFMPPEQALGHNAEIDGRTDLWAVGAIMFYVLTGKLVHTAETVNKVLLSAMTRQAPPLASLVPDVPRDLCEVIDRALAFQRDKRWPNAQTMQRSLRTVRQSLPPTSHFLPMSRTTAGAPNAAHMSAALARTHVALEPSGSKNQRFVFAVAGTMAAIVAVVVLVFVVTRGPRGNSSASTPSAAPERAALPSVTTAARVDPPPPTSATTAVTAADPPSTSKQTNAGTAVRPTATTKSTKPTSSNKTELPKDIFSTF